MDLTALLIGPLALALRYLLILAAGALAKAGIGLFDAATGTFTLHVDSASNVIAALVVFAAALLWRKVAVWMGGRT